MFTDRIQCVSTSVHRVADIARERANNKTVAVSGKGRGMKESSMGMVEESKAQSQVKKELLMLTRVHTHRQLLLIMRRRYKRRKKKK